jgi:hypothetical protein
VRSGVLRSIESDPIDLLRSIESDPIDLGDR